MKRIIFGSLALFFSGSAPAWAQIAAPKPEQEGGNFLGWLLLLFIGFVLAYLIYVMVRARKAYGAVDRSLQIAEESLQLAKHQAALQAETNRLLGQLLDAQGRGDRI
jgi:hypothetical protein